jgi:hypothetical protein
MRALRFLNLAILSILVGSAASVYAQEEKPQEDKPARQEEAKPEPKQEEAKPSRQEEAKPSKQDKQDKQMEKQDQKRGEQQSHEQQMPDRQEHPDMKDNRTGQRQAENGHAGGKGGHIPDDKFRSHFGQGHHFKARGVIVAGRPQFQYGGYNFELVDAWPADWAYTDDCYIDYIDGEYFLFDLAHPGVRLAVFVVL